MRLGFNTCMVSALWLAVAACGGDENSSAPSGPGTNLQQDCLIRFAVTSGGSIAALNVDVDYRRAPGKFVGENRDTACNRLDDRMAINGVNWNCSDQSHCPSGDLWHPTLLIQSVTIHEVATPIDLLDCRFRGEAIPDVKDFDIVVENATDEEKRAVAPWPTVAITQIECRDATGTTTSTTLPSPCDDISCPTGEACRDGVCSPVTGYEIDLGFDTDDELAALQFAVSYDCSDGHFDGVGTTCAASRTGRLTSFPLLMGSAAMGQRIPVD